MIKVNNKGIEIRGTKISLMSDFTHIVDALRENYDFDDEDFETCLKISKMTDEEISAEIEKFFEENRDIIEDFFNMLSELTDVVKKD